MAEVTIRAVERTVAIIKVLANERRPLGIAYLAEAEGRIERHRSFQPGVTQDAHATCDGKVLLAEG